MAEALPSFAHDAEPQQIAVTIGGLDHTENAPPAVHGGTESRVSRLRVDDGLPRLRTQDDPGPAGAI